ncbi:MAG: MerR family transcriptional regulator [Lachnospiraceae bacterium]|nr:MerR family transcriptional regulator [Lachnospiraceae bacterium]
MEGYYSVKEMTQKLGIEAHMLRYWEKELELDIPRDGHGRRIYGEEEANLLERVSAYKKDGKPLRMIKGLIQLPGQEEEKEEERKILIYRPGKAENDNAQEVTGGNGANIKTGTKEAVDETGRTQRMQQLLGEMVAEALRESSSEMITEMKESILKELDYQFRLQGERQEELQEKLLRSQEEHFECLDVMLREGSNRKKRKLWR